MKLSGTSRLTDVVRRLRGAAGVFESLGIDYSCAGERTIDEVARTEGVDPHLVISSLRRLPETPESERWSDRSLTDLAHHLAAAHHKLVCEELAAVGLELAEICSDAGAPAGMTELRAAFVRLSDFVLPHLRNEEQVVLQEIEHLATADVGARSPGAGLRKHIADVLVAHGAISQQLRELRELRIALEDQEDMTPAAGQALVRLAWLEAHLHEYMFLENCILLPRAIAVDEQMALV